MPRDDPSADAFTVLDSVTVPDLWQQEAVGALQAGKDVVVHAPTGAGKTLIFELDTEIQNASRSLEKLHESAPQKNNSNVVKLASVRR